MDQRVSFITLVVTDLEATRTFYVDGLGWQPDYGYTGYFADPDGFRWEVAYNPGEIGQSVLP